MMEERLEKLKKKAKRVKRTIDRLNSGKDRHLTKQFSMIVLVFSITIAAIVMLHLLKPPEIGVQMPVLDVPVEQSYTSNLTQNPEIEMPMMMSEESYIYENGTRYFANATNRYKFAVPEGYNVYQSSGIIYIRRPEDRTQIAFIYMDGPFSDGTYVWEKVNLFIYKLKAYLTDKEGVTEEKGVANYGADTKYDRVVGDYEVKQELSEMWWRNEEEQKNIVLPGFDYYTTMEDGAGIAMIGTTQTQEDGEMVALLDGILASLKRYTPDKPSLNMKSFLSITADMTSFMYPSGWTMTQNEDGMVVIKAPTSLDNVYNGMIIEYYADTHEIVDDPMQFSGEYEDMILAPVFTQTLGTDAFDTQKTVDEMDREYSIGEKPAYFFDISDRIFPRSNAVKNSMQLGVDTYRSKRYCYESAGICCFINFIVPNEQAEQLADEILATVKMN